MRSACCCSLRYTKCHMKTALNESIEQSTVAKNPSKIWLQALKWTGLFICLFCLITFLGLISLIYLKINKFTNLTNTSVGELKALAQASWQRTPIQTDGRKNILILGTDAVANRDGHAQLTDTMIFASIDLSAGKIYLLSLPRDLWSEEYKTKINALYVYGAERFPNSPEQFPQLVIGKLLNQPIHHTLVISMDELSQIIDVLEGVKVEVAQSFTDPEFPRSDVDISSTDPNVLYKTVKFTAGKEVMNGERALEYIRSRHADGETGTDLSRSQRQQAVIQAMITKLMQKDTILNIDKLASLFNLYHEQFAQYLSLEELGASGKQLYKVKNEISLEPLSLSLYPDSETGVIEHPSPKLYNNQWVYKTRDTEMLEKEVKEKLNSL